MNPFSEQLGCLFNTADFFWVSNGFFHSFAQPIFGRRLLVVLSERRILSVRAFFHELLDFDALWLGFRFRADAEQFFVDATHDKAQ